ncbi:glycosyltransferase family 2 protein [Mastigocoleus testarum]|uniref:Family 2 glycosyl transferase n=1 Tax=Mastigocoleus testarum BC008 TaxID=371196 RepID=A0A0V7ZGT0_9CYAN|nr:glycosyltransferase family 2 protein [Mastigocoleus testarum]KST63649.1 family 2 glycosyl transferase [Mastigocoleus testarum BC008]
MSPKISIITPCYNSEKTIEKTIQSVIEQQSTYQIEYIVIDGGSTDLTCEIINQYSQYISKFISEPDSGAYDAMNKGIKVATGDIIGIINSDDWYNPNAIKIVEKEFDKYPDIDIIYSPIDNYFAEEYVAKFIPGKLDKLIIRFTLNHPSCFIKKHVYNTVGLYNIQYSIAADYAMILQIFLLGYKFHYVDIPLAAYSLNGMSSSNNPWDRLKLIRESWIVSTQTLKSLTKKTILQNNLPKHLTLQRFQAYLLWVINEIFALPIRYFLKPPTARKLKQYITKYVRQPISKDYGQW